MINKMKIYCDTEVTPKAVLVYFYLCERASEKNRVCFPSIRTISRDVNLSENSVKRSLRELEKGKYIEKENRFRKNGGKTSNLYHIL